MLDKSWRKSSFSNGNGGNNCVEAKQSSLTRDTLIRHSRFPADWMAFTEDEWRAFVAGVKAGEFDVRD